MKVVAIVGLLAVLCGCHGPTSQPLAVPPGQGFACQLSQPVDQQVQYTGGTAPYTFSIISGALPPGLVMDPVTGEITGTPIVRGTFMFQVQVQDSSGLPRL